MDAETAPAERTKICSHRVRKPARAREEEPDHLLESRLSVNRESSTIRHQQSQQSPLHGPRRLPFQVPARLFGTYMWRYYTNSALFPDGATWIGWVFLHPFRAPTEGQYHTQPWSSGQESCPVSIKDAHKMKFLLPRSPRTVVKIACRHCWCYSFDVRETTCVSRARFVIQQNCIAKTGSELTSRKMEENKPNGALVCIRVKVCNVPDTRSAITTIAMRVKDFMVADGGYENQAAGAIMSQVLNALMVIMNYAGGQKIATSTYLDSPDQFSAKVEVVLSKFNLVEEFHITYDRTLNLARFEYTLDDKVPPYYSSNPTRTVWDLNTGTFYDLDVTTGLCRISFAKNDTSSEGISSQALLKMLSPDQLFAVNRTVMMKYVKKDLTRGMASDVWNSDLSDFYLAGTGVVPTRHILRTLATDTRKYYSGSNQSNVLLQRSIYAINPNNTADEDPVLTINYFDIDAPSSSKIYDFNVLTCLKNIAIEPPEEIMVHFEGRLNLPADVLQGEDQSVVSTRRKIWKEISKTMGISPVRSVGNFWSQDDSHSYFSTVILPRPAQTSYFKKSPSLAAIRFRGYGLDPSGSRTMELGFESLIQTCAERCRKDATCQQFAWCPGTNSWKMFTCVLQPDTNITSPGTTDILPNCELYQDKDFVGRSSVGQVDQIDVTSALDKLGAAIKQRSLSVALSGGEKTTLTAVSLRRNVSLMASTKGEKTVETYALYKSYSVLKGRAKRAGYTKLTNKQCTEKCQNEQQFLCHSFSTCGYGDCFLSDLHGDEIGNAEEDLLSNHSHCSTWSRIWSNEFVKVSSSFFSTMEPERLNLKYVENMETCAKQCFFPDQPDGECESFRWCPKTTYDEASRSWTTAISYGCSNYAEHVFDQGTNGNKVEPAANQTCLYYSKNYLTSFKEIPATALTKTPQDEIQNVLDVPARLAEWRCAKACIDLLGDAACLALEICNLEGALAGSHRCRYSAAQVVIDKKHKRFSNVTVPNEACNVFTRTKFLDGSLVPDRLDNTMRSKLERRSNVVQICLPSGGYTSTEMAALGLCMLVLGCAVVVLMFFAARRFLPVREVAFVRFRDPKS